jgi:hypothetical protein
MKFLLYDILEKAKMMITVKRSVVARGLRKGVMDIGAQGICILYATVMMDTYQSTFSMPQNVQHKQGTLV